MERVTSELANFLASDMGCEVHLILMAKEQEFFSIDQRVTIHAIDSVSSIRVLTMARKFLKLRQILTELKPQAVLSFGSMYNSFVLLAAKGLNIRVYVSDRSNPNRNSKATLRRDPINRHDGIGHFLLKRCLYRSAAGIFVQTKLAHDIESRVFRHANIVPFPNPARPINSQSGSRREKVVLNVGRFIPTKNQLELIDIFSTVRLNGWRLLFLGDGPTRKAAEEKVREDNLEGVVFFAGNVTNVDNYLASSEIFAFTSLSEGFPNVLLEGMSAGLACVSYDCVAGPSEIIDDEVSGYLVPPGDQVAFGKRLRELMMNESLRHTFRTNAKASLGRFEQERVFSNVKRELLSS
jgi:glycosyltransferase involved in cell wall biosynthesis